MGYYIDQKDIRTFASRSHAVGFCEDYKRVIVNARHELILI